jgi:hypothetical protein
LYWFYSYYYIGPCFEHINQSFTEDARLHFSQTNSQSIPGIPFLMSLGAIVDWKIRIRQDLDALLTSARTNDGSIE